MSGNKMFKLSIGRGRGISLVPSVVEVPAEPAAAAEPKGAQAPERGASGTMRGSTRDSRSIVRTKPTSMYEKVGSSGAKLSLTANYFRVVKAPDFEFCMYRVEFEPPIDSVNMRKAFVARQKEMLGGYLYDGASMVYLTRRLDRDSIDYATDSREGVNYTISLQHVGDIKITDGMLTQVLNLILRRMMEGLKMQQVGRNLYDPENKVALKEYKLELWPGYITSIRQHEENILVCAEVSHKVMRLETVYDILSSAAAKGGDWKESFKREIISSVVLTDYNNKTYRIDDVDFNSSPSSTFMKKDKEMTYIEYYKERYGKIIRDMKQPMLISKPKARDVRDAREQILFLVPELCRLTGLTDKMRSDFRMMKAMAEHTQMDPENRKRRLLEFTKRLHESEESKKALKAFSTDIGTSLVEFNGRALAQETMLFGESKKVVNNNSVDWSNSFKNCQMFFSVPLKRWAFLYPANCAFEAAEFLKLMMEVAENMNYKVAEPKKVELQSDRIKDYVDSIKEIMAKDPTLILVVVPNNAADRYTSIKRLTCLDKPIPTQVVVKKTMVPKKGLTIGSVKSIATKVIIQINCKLGGIPWMITIPVKGLMTVGFDVTHDTQDRSKSFGAFIASMDCSEDSPEPMKYFSAVSAHKEGTEGSQNIALHMIKALQVYRAEHQSLPEKIFFYRDGVSDGQIEYVYSQEVQILEAKLNEIYVENGDGKKPKFAFIIVNKRLNTKIFLKKGSEVLNPVSGTVVDTEITLPERYDFYLISQAVRQGTVAPTSYNVIYDTSGLSPDRLQIMTYKMCHLYYNWSGTVRVPAVVQYAHKLALLSGEFLHQPPSQNFKNQIYFL